MTCLIGRRCILRRRQRLRNHVYLSVVLASCGCRAEAKSTELGVRFVLRRRLLFFEGAVPQHVVQRPSRLRTWKLTARGWWSSLE